MEQRRQLAYTWGQQMLAPIGLLVIIILFNGINWLSIINVATTTTNGEELIELACAAKPEQERLAAEECKQFQNSDIESHCEGGNCICTKQGNGERVTCQPQEQKLTNIITGPCPCPQKYAECNETFQICLCEDFYVPSADRRRCVPESVPLDGECEMDSQCQFEGDAFVYCHPAMKRCLCTPNFVPYHGRCVPLLEMTCGDDNDCNSCGASICLTQVERCACNKFHTKNDNGTRCVPAVHYNGICAHDAQCQVLLGTGAFCDKHKCHCNERHYMYINPNEPSQLHDDVPTQRCLAIPLFGWYCRDHDDCRRVSLEPGQSHNMECSLGECICSEGFKKRKLREKEFLCVNRNSAPSLTVSVFAIFLVLFHILQH